MKLIFAVLAGCVVVMSVMYATVSIVLESKIVEGLIVGSVGLSVLVSHLYMTDPPNFDDGEESDEEEEKNG